MTDLEDAIGALRTSATTTPEVDPGPEDMLELASLGLLDRSPKSNWVEDNGGLPRYIEEVANSLHTKRGMTISQAIAVAVSRMKVWAATGEPDTKAKAAKALAEWEALKAKSRAKKAAKKD